MTKDNTYTHQQVIDILAESFIDSGKVNNNTRAKTIAKAWLELKLVAGLVKPIKKKNVKKQQQS
jgi:hypothetical protein